MSYDVDAGGDCHNITSNLHQFFKDFDAYPPSWHGRPREEVAAEITTALKMIESNDLATLKVKYDSPNGWGEVEHAVTWLMRVKSSCLKEIPDLVEVSW